MSFTFGTTNAKVPCKNCTERVVGCHSTCKRYKEYRAICDNNIDKRMKNVEIKEMTKAVKRELVKKCYKKKSERERGLK